MTPEQILAVLDDYDALLVRELLGHAEPHEFNPTQYMGAMAWARTAQLRHLRSMIPRMRAFVAEDRYEKAFRWLGFMQGVLWTGGLFTLDELKNHNRPDQRADANTAERSFDANRDDPDRY